MKEKLSSALSYCLGLCIWGVIIYFTFGRCVSRNIQERKEKQRREFLADSLAKRKQFVADSLTNDPHYQDRLRTEKERIDRKREERRKWIGTHTLVVIGEWNDSIDNLYHTTTKCNTLYNYHDTTLHARGTRDIKKYKLVSELAAIEMGYEECSSCEEFEDIYNRYEDGEIVDLEDVEE